jgi:hypothetical protein
LSNLHGDFELHKNKQELDECVLYGCILCRLIDEVLYEEDEKEGQHGAVLGRARN